MGALCGPYLLGSTIDLVWGMKDENGCKQAWTGCRWIHVDAKDASIQEPPHDPHHPSKSEHARTIFKCPHHLWAQGHEQVWVGMNTSFSIPTDCECKKFKQIQWQQLGFECPHHLWVSQPLNMNDTRTIRPRHLPKFLGSKPKATTAWKSNRIKKHKQKMIPSWWMNERPHRVNPYNLPDPSPAKLLLTVTNKQTV